MGRSSRIVAALVAVAVAMTCAGCAGEQPVIDPAAFRALVVQPVELGAAEAVELRRCMHAAGFDVARRRAFSGSSPDLPVTPGPGGYGDALDRGMPGVDEYAAYAARLDPAEAARFAATLDDPSSPRARFVSPAGRAASASTDGCAARARRAVYGSVEDALLLAVTPLDAGLMVAEMYLHPRAVEATAAYRGCMEAGGYTVRFPQDAQALAQVSVVSDGSGPAAAERQVAAVDGRCQALTRVSRIYLDVLTGIAAPWVAEHAELTARAGEVVARSLDRARTILAGVSSP